MGGTVMPSTNLSNASDWSLLDISEGKGTLLSLAGLMGLHCVPS